MTTMSVSLVVVVAMVVVGVIMLGAEPASQPYLEYKSERGSFGRP